jgi:hypothetical protein
MAGRSRKQASAVRKRRSRDSGFFKREAEWMGLINLAPFVVGLLLALIFWLTR